MNVPSIIFFLTVCWSVGYVVSYLFNAANNFLERNIMRVGIGLGAIPIFLTIINLLSHNSINYLVLSPIVFVAAFLALKNFKKIEFDWKSKENIFIYLVCIMFIFTLFMFVKGAFAYPWLEDTDPWGHAVGIKYIATEKTMFDPEGLNWNDYIKDRTTYVDPYPGAYDGILAILYQISNQMMWTMKFFNALIISLGIFFFYFFVKSFTKDENIALLSTFVLTMIPSYLSHFIWAHALVVTLFFPLMYCVINDKEHLSIPAVFILASILVLHPEQAIKIGVLLAIYYIVKIIYTAQFRRSLLVSFVLLYLIAGAFALTWWGPVVADNGGPRNIADQSLAKVTEKSSFLDGLKVVFNPASGTGTRAYTFTDFFIAPKQNAINNPVGWGWMVSLLLIIGIIAAFIYMKQHSWLLTTVLWFVLLFIFVNSMTFNLPFGFMAFRIWMLLAIPVSILAGYAIYNFKTNNNKATYSIWIVFLIFIFITSGIPKYTVNTAIWGTWFGQATDEELTGYSQLSSIIPVGSRVFSLSGFQGPLIAYDMDVCEWCVPELTYGRDILYYNAEYLHKWLTEHNYQYFVIDGRSLNAHQPINGNNTMAALQSFVQDMETTKLFNPIVSSNGFALVEVK